MTCETCGGDREVLKDGGGFIWRKGSEAGKVLIKRFPHVTIPCPDCHCGQQSCCEGSKEETSEEGS